ncbi:MAG: hypothetical protein HN975_18535 [Anaerolineae bacterium]|nr:hypothetical protein [Anaerolineae bacterium]
MAFFWSQSGVPSWSCLLANAQVALASPDLGCTTTCTSWSGDPCSGYSSCFNKNISCVNGVDQNGRSCQGCCFSCKVTCTNPDTPPTFTQTDLTCSQSGLGGWCIGTQTLNLTATENILISGDIGGTPFACNDQASPASCSVPLPEDSGAINYTAMSSIGLSSNGSTNWQRDATLPVINGQVDQTPNANNWFNTNITVTASASDAASGSGLLSFETSLDDVTWVAYSAAMPFGEGTRTLYLRATDNAGNVEKINIPLNVDMTDPVPSRVIGGLSGSNGWYSSSITVTASATDGGAGVDALATTLDGSTWATYSAPLTLTDGTYTLQVKATDLAGNQASTTSETLKVDATAPSTSVSLSGTQGSANWYTSAVSASVSSTDATSGIASTSYNLNGAGWAAYSIPLTLNDGVHTLQARATDYAGHQQLSTLETVYVDTTAPSLALFLDGGTSFLGWQAAAVEISATASDAGSGLSGFEISVNGGAWQTYSAPFTLSDGTHTVEARATDVAGNLVTVSETVNVDTTSPGISISLNGTAGNGDWFISAVEASATPSAPGSGIASFEYALAGGSWQAYTAPLNFDDGVHILYLRATNNAGKIREVTQVIKVDTVAPAIALPDAWQSDEYIYYETEDPTSGLDSLRLVVEDDAERWPKAVIKESLSGNNHDATFLWDGKWGDGNYATFGTYYLCVKVTDVAGNQGVQCGAVTVAAEEEQEDEAPVVIVPTEPPVVAEVVPVVEAPVPEPFDTEPKELETPFTFGSKPNTPATTAPVSENLALGATAAAALGALLATTTKRKKKPKAANKRTSFFGRAKRQSVPSSPASVPSTQPTSATVLWGEAASSVIGAFTAKIEERKRKIEEERKRREEEAARIAKQKAEAAEKRRNSLNIAPANTGGAPKLTKHQKFMIRMGWAKPKRLSYGEIAKAYQRSLNNFRATLKASGLSASEAAKQGREALRNGKIPSAAAVISNYRQEKRLEKKEKFLNPAPPPTEPSLAEVQKQIALEAQKDSELDSATQHYMAMGSAVANGEFSKEGYDKAREQAEENRQQDGKYQGDVLADYMESKNSADVHLSATVGGEGTRDEWTELEIKRAKEGIPWEIPEKEKSSLFERIRGWIQDRTITREQDPINRALEEELRRNQILAEQFEIENQYSNTHPASDLIRAGANEIENEKKIDTSYRGDVLADYHEGRDWSEAAFASGIPGSIGTQDEWTELETKRADEGVLWEMPEKEKLSFFERIRGEIQDDTITRRLGEFLSSKHDYIQNSLPTIGLTTYRKTFPIVWLPSALEIGGVFSEQSAASGNQHYRLNLGGESLSGKQGNISTFFSYDKKYNPTLGMRVAGSETLTLDDGSLVNFGKSAIVRVEWNQIWNASISVDVNTIDVSVQHSNQGTGNGRIGFYMEVTPVPAIGAVVLIAALLSTPFPDEVGMIEILRRAGQVLQGIPSE